MNLSSFENLNPPNTSGERIPKRKLRKEKLARDYPNSLRQVKNPLSRDSALTGHGAVLEKLGVVEAQLEGVPKLLPRIKEAVGTLAEAISIIEGDDNPDSIAFMAKWNSLTVRDKRYVHIEDVIIAAGLTTRRFMELLAGASFEHSASVSKIFVSRSQLKVLQATVKAATDQEIKDEAGKVTGVREGDVRAQEIFHKITGALPTPKGANFTFNQQINKNDDPDPKPERQPLQTMDSWLLEIDDIRKPKQLSAPIIPVEMPMNAPEVEYLEVEE